jgi:phospholipase/carboxylesterase
MHDRLDRLPGVDKRMTGSGAIGSVALWINERVRLAQPGCLSRSREFAHIHPDGSFHVRMSPVRVVTAVDRGWAERHPWSYDNPDFVGYTMVFAPRSIEEIGPTLQLIVDAFNFLTGRQVTLTGTS